MLLLLPCGYRPQGGRTGQRIFRRMLGRLTTSRASAGDDASNKLQRPPDDRQGKM
jgi:hypothetical protein